MTNDPQKFLVYAAMRNEGAFIVEWVTWYKMLGFDVLVGSNGCTDHSVQLLDRLAEEGWLTHAPHVPNEDEAPKKSAHRSARNHPLVAETDWLLICDVDEFLVLHTGDTTIQEYIGDGIPDFMGIAFNWRCFGSGGWKKYQAGLVHQQFRRCGVSALDVNDGFKTLFRHPTRFGKYGAHSPREFDGTWGENENRWVNSIGTELPYLNPNGDTKRHFEMDDINHETAQMNHYIIRSTESFDLKKGRPSASAGRDRYTQRFHKRYNRNGALGVTARRFDSAFEPLFEQAMALPGIRQLHHQCCADYVQSLCENQNIDPETDERFQHHMTEANKA